MDTSFNEEYSLAFKENEKQANLYSVHCMQVLSVVMVVIWLLNCLGVFIVPTGIMNTATIGGMLFLLLPSLLLRFLDQDSPRLKYYTLLCCIFGITFLSSALPSHAILAWAIPVVLGCHYYSKKFSYGLLFVSIVCMGISLIIGTYYGEWDSNLLKAVQASGPRVVTGETIRRVVLFYFLPRSLILFGLTTICATLSDRTRALLERQVKDSKEKQQIASELEVATHIQTSMLPCVFPAFPSRKEFDIYATMMPAKDVGGDFYDFFLVDDNHLALVIADVSGKGVPAALFMVIAKTLIKDRAQEGTRPDEVFTKVNKLLCEANEEGLFVTAWLGVIEISSGRLDYVNAGHNPPLVRTNEREYEYLRTKCNFVLAGFEETKYCLCGLNLSIGDSLFLYTDGVTEATNERKELYGEKRLKDILNKNKEKTSKELIEAVKKDVDDFVGNASQFDDITMLSFCYHQQK